MSKKPYIAAVIAAALVNIVAWLHGYNYDARGSDAVTVFLITIIAALAAGAVTAAAEDLL